MRSRVAAGVGIAGASSWPVDRLVAALLVRMQAIATMELQR
jgi:hypothetical protein